MPDADPPHTLSLATDPSPREDALLTRASGPLLAVLLVAAPACVPGSAGGEADTGGGPPGLELSLEPSSDRVPPGGRLRLTLIVRNASGDTLELEFPTSQRYDFALRRETGAVVWSWAADRAFLQVIGRERLGPGDSLRWSVGAHAPDRPGRYVAAGILPLPGGAPEATARIRVEAANGDIEGDGGDSADAGQGSQR